MMPHGEVTESEIEETVDLEAILAAHAAEIEAISELPAEAFAQRLAARQASLDTIITGFKLAGSFSVGDGIVFATILSIYDDLEAAQVWVRKHGDEIPKVEESSLSMSLGDDEEL